MLKGLEITALQITPVHYLFKPDAEHTIEHFRAIYEETQIPILIYNVIPWNYLSAEHDAAHHARSAGRGRHEAEFGRPQVGVGSSCRCGRDTTWS